MTIKDNHAAPHIGDTVRVIVEGTCTDSDSTGFQIRSNSDTPRLASRYFNFRYTDTALTSVEVTKRNYAEGDIINRDDLLPWDPTPGSVIVKSSGQGPRRWMKINNGKMWIDTTGALSHPAAMPSGDYKIEVVA